eukprot:2439342-Prymnesium_polylepis.1
MAFMAWNSTKPSHAAPKPTAAEFDSEHNHGEFHFFCGARAPRGAHRRRPALGRRDHAAAPQDDDEEDLPPAVGAHLHERRRPVLGPRRAARAGGGRKGEERLRAARRPAGERQVHHAPRADARGAVGGVRGGGGARRRVDGLRLG